MRRAEAGGMLAFRTVEHATGETALSAANASSGVHREAQRLCPMCSAGAEADIQLTIYVTSQPAQTLNQ